MRTVSAVATAATIVLAGIAAAAAPAPPCVGDCRGADAVAIDDLLTMVTVALGTASVAVCPAGDPNGDGSITVDEVLAAVQSALCGCGESCGAPTPTATEPSTRTPTRTPSPTPTPTLVPTRTPTPTTASTSCTRIKQGDWCLLIGNPSYLGWADRFTQTGCLLTGTDPSLRGPLVGNRWEIRYDDLDITFVCVFSGNPATRCDGSATVGDRVVPICGTFGSCGDSPCP